MVVPFKVGKHNIENAIGAPIKQKTCQSRLNLP
jgi:hypothetical protein